MITFIQNEGSIFDECGGFVVSDLKIETCVYQGLMFIVMNITREIYDAAIMEWSKALVGNTRSIIQALYMCLVVKIVSFA